MNRIPTKQEMTAALNERHGALLQQSFTESSIAVCGLGGLGSNIAVSLARAGIGSLILIDFDCVDISNLHRQQYKVSQIGKPKTEALAENLWRWRQRYRRRHGTCIFPRHALRRTSGAHCFTYSRRGI